jgi:1,4-dihydroxy-2-naphthoate octaprenyltransferase
MRDEESDRKSNKNTIVVKMGASNAKVYHYCLIISAMILILLFTALSAIAIAVVVSPCTNTCVIESLHFMSHRTSSQMLFSAFLRKGAKASVLEEQALKLMSKINE